MPQITDEIADEDITAVKFLTESQRKREQKVSTEFITGTWEREWLRKAEEVNACWVALNLLRLSTMRKSDRFKFSATQTAEDLGLSRPTLWRKLNALEKAGLIAVERCQRRWPKVRLLGQFRATPAERPKR